MEIEAKSYLHFSRDNEAEYIYRYYLPKQVRDLIQPPDIAAIERSVWRRIRQEDDYVSTVNAIKAENCVIRYRAEGLVKIIEADTMETVLKACTSWWGERWNRDFTDDENKYLLGLNELLRQLELTIRKETDRCNNELILKIAANEAFLSDYEVEEHITFLLADDDPWWEEDDDNLLYEYKRTKTESPGWKTDDDEHVDYNDKRSSFPEHPLYQVPHCWLFHELEDHSPVPMKHLCRIGFIWTNVEVMKQNLIDFKKLRQKM